MATARGTLAVPEACYFCPVDDRAGESGKLGSLEELPPAFGPEFYQRNAEAVARDLLGSVLLRHGDPPRIGTIVETEAYLGEHDAASHARFGRTGRTEVMYGPPGMSYVYLIYGMYNMLNVVCAPRGDPQAVLVRAIVPLAGIASRVDGPGKLTRALEIDRSFNALPLWRSPLSIHPGTPFPQCHVTPRIGIDYAGEWREAPLRYVAIDTKGGGAGPSGAAR